MAISRICAIPDCGKRRYCRGLCKTHYSRRQKYGDPLGGGTFHGEGLKFFREIALKYDGDECLTWPFGRDSKGYYGRLKVDGRTHLAHRLVCEVAHGPAPTPEHEAAHSCGNGHLGCVAKRHLSWKTRSGNQKDRVEHGTHVRGSRNAGAKLTEPDVLAIRAMRGKCTQRALAERFGVTTTLIRYVQLRKNWAWLE